MARSFTLMCSGVGSAPCVPIVASIVAADFANSLPCTSLMAIGICCDALSSVGREVADGSNRRPRRPKIDVDWIYRNIEIGIAQILGLKQSRQASLGDKLFHRRPPTASVQSNVSIGLAQSMDLANRLFAENQMAFAAETRCFRRSASSEAAFTDFLKASRARQTGNGAVLY